MTKIKIVLFLLLGITLTNCTTEKHKFPMEKRYWDLNDYKSSILELRFGYDDDEALPTLDDPNTKMIVEKLTDQQNFKVVLDDKELGTKHRNDIGTQFFNRWRDMIKIYTATDRKDNYVYDEEYLATWHFGLGLQMRYFTLGNDVILENADDPKSSRIVNLTNSNIQILIDNYLAYLDLINKEDAFTEQGKKELANGIDIYFSTLITTYPDSNYSGLKSKATLMLKKSKTEVIKVSLQKLLNSIESIKK